MRHLSLVDRDEEDSTINIVASIRGMNVESGRYYGFIPFDSIITQIQGLRSSIVIHPFIALLHWPLHLFFINRFCNAMFLQLTVNTESSDAGDAE